MAALSPALPRGSAPARRLLRHVLATLAYRAGKAVRGTPAAFGGYRVTKDSNSSAEILAHMGDLMEWVLRTAKGTPRWTTARPLAWSREIARFFRTLGALDRYIASRKPLRWDLERLFQGGIADAFTHTGQLAMMRRLGGFKMKGETYARADIRIGRVGLRQTPPDPANEFS